MVRARFARFFILLFDIFSWRIGSENSHAILLAEGLLMVFPNSGSSLVRRANSCTLYHSTSMLPHCFLCCTSIYHSLTSFLPQVNLCSAGNLADCTIGYELLHHTFWNDKSWKKGGYIPTHSTERKTVRTTPILYITENDSPKNFMLQSFL